MPITYDRAFGGLDDIGADKSRHSAYMPNPVGCGYHKQLEIAYVDGTPRAQHRRAGKPGRPSPTRPTGRCRSGPVGRGWQPRLGFAGTYDQNWLDNVFPFLPADFRDDYYQAAPADQQIPYPKGGEEVLLVNLTPEGRTGFRLPVVDLPFVFIPAKGEREERTGVLDTVVIEPDQRRVILDLARQPAAEAQHLRDGAGGGRPHAARLVAGARSRQDLLPLAGRPRPGEAAGARGGGGMTAPPVAIVGAGMMTGVGLTAPASCAAIRCAIDNFTETRFMARGGEWIIGSAVPLEQPWRGQAKLVKMLAGPVRECLDLVPEAPAEDIPLLVCVAERDRPGRLDGLDNSLFFELQQELGASLPSPTRR